MGKTSRSRSKSPSLFKSICSGKGKISKGKKKSRSRSKSGCPCKSSRAKGKSRSRSRSRRKSKGKCYKPGIMTRNPFLNFLREYRKSHCGKTIIQIAVAGAREWNKMPDEKKIPYVRAACSAPKYKKKSKLKRLKGTKKRRKR